MKIWKPIVLVDFPDIDFNKSVVKELLTRMCGISKVHYLRYLSRGEHEEFEVVVFVDTYAILLSTFDLATNIHKLERMLDCIDAMVCLCTDLNMVKNMDGCPFILADCSENEYQSLSDEKKSTIAGRLIFEIFKHDFNNEFSWGLRAYPKITSN